MSMYTHPFLGAYRFYSDLFLYRFYPGVHIEGGASVRQVAAYLGHSSLKPVMVYLHLTEISEAKARSALATLATS